MSGLGYFLHLLMELKMRNDAQFRSSVLVTGSSGFLGSLIINSLKDEYHLLGVSRSDTNPYFYQCDLTSDEKVTELAQLISPDVIIHAAGLKNIQFCEENPEIAYMVNSQAVKNIASHFPAAKIIYISTDYVFSGDDGMYLEQDVPNPKTVYGKSKYEGEIIGRKIAGKNFKVVRTASIFSENSSFINYLRDSIANNVPIKSYSDCVFSPTYINDLVASLKTLIEGDYTQDIFHVVGDEISRYYFAKAYFEVGNYDLKNLVKSENKGEHIYLFKNLSLSGAVTENNLSLHPTKLKVAFSKFISAS